MAKVTRIGERIHLPLSALWDGSRTVVDTKSGAILTRAAPGAPVLFLSGTEEPPPEGGTMSAEVARRQSRRTLALRMQKAKEEQALRAVNALGKLATSVVKARSVPPTSDAAEAVVHRKP